MEIVGIFKKTIYQTDKGYIVGLFRIKECSEKEYINTTVTFTGFFHELVIDDQYTFTGEFTTHSKYGKQFSVTSYAKVKPTDKVGVIEFLSSDLFPGIGPSMAKSIVDRLGSDALNIILNNNEALDGIPKLTLKKKNTIIDTLNKYEESNEIYVYLTEIGFNIKEAMIIYNRFKKRTKDIINNNIYDLIELDELNFPKIDLIATSKDLVHDKAKRIEACIIFVMESLTFESGDTYLEYENIYSALENYLHEEILIDDFDNYLYDLETSHKIIYYNKHYYLKDMFDNENYIADTVAYLSSRLTEKVEDVDLIIKAIEKDLNIEYNDDQKAAIRLAINNDIVIITGGPGTGKTTIIKAITEAYRRIKGYSIGEFDKKLALLAPTGRASKRMSEATAYPASTIHRYLKWDKDSNRFGVDEFNPNPEELVIVDEVSMIDTNLFASLLRGIKRNVKLVLVGDYNQLPSVGPGEILRDLIDSEMINTVYLNLLYRQEENSYINTLAMEIRDNEISETIKEKKDDFVFLECDSNSIIHNLKVICKRLIIKGYDYKRVQIMAPIYKGINGIDNLNNELQEIFNPKSPKKDEYVSGDIIYRVGDKVLQLVNIPELNVYNGDIGVILAIELVKGKEVFKIDFDGNIVMYPVKELNKIKHGFVISIHKSQGSEFEMVVMPICPSYKRMLYRKLLYTGVTRAKRKLIVIGDLNSFLTCAKNESNIVRNTSLKDRIISVINKK